MSRQTGKQQAANQWAEQSEKDGKKVLRTNDIDPNKELRGKPFNWFVTMDTETYTDKINWTLDQKIFHLFEVIDVYYHKMNGEVYLNFSGGKDSTTLKHFLDVWTDMMGYPRIRCLFNDTTNEYKEILTFVRSFVDAVEWTRPKMTFVQTLKKYGYPVISKEQAMRISRYRGTKREDQKRLRLFGIRPDGSKAKIGFISMKWRFAIAAPFLITERCCDILKKQPIARFEKKTGLKPIVGTMSTESNGRKLSYLKNGNCNVFAKGKEKCSPLSLFTEDNIWECIDKFNIEICSVYFDQEIDGELVTGEKRTGCAYCAFGAQCEDPKNNRFTRLAKREPKRYKSMMDKMGYREVLNFIGIELPDNKDLFDIDLLDECKVPVQDLGFNSKEERLKMISEVDTKSTLKMKRFKVWEYDDKTKDGLLKLILHKHSVTTDTK